MPPRSHTTCAEYTRSPICSGLRYTYSKNNFFIVVAFAPSGSGEAGKNLGTSPTSRQTVFSEFPLPSLSLTQLMLCCFFLFIEYFLYLCVPVFLEQAESIWNFCDINKPRAFTSEYCHWITQKVKYTMLTRRNNKAKL